MKKISLLLAVTTLMWSCNQSYSKKEISKDTTDAGGVVIKKKAIAHASKADSIPIVLVHKSLNGIDSADVKKMTDEFNSVIYQKIIPRSKESIWFSEDIIRNMYALLLKERAGRLSKDIGTPDGFRIYFISRTSDKTDLSVAIVSTKNKGTYPGTSTIWHTDYYYHDGGMPLYTSSKDISGEKGTGSCDGGALLNDPCRLNCADNCIISPSHDISRAEGENMTTHFGNKEINTQAVWFDFEMLASIIESKVAFDGIRIYTSNYGDTNSLGRPVDPPSTPVLDRKQQRDTFVFTLTKDSTIVATSDHPQRHTQRDNFNCNTLEKVRKYFFSKAAGLNNGELCPSHCNN